jgi:hypothetical protein
MHICPSSEERAKPCPVLRYAAAKVRKPLGDFFDRTSPGGRNSRRPCCDLRSFPDLDLMAAAMANG